MTDPTPLTDEQLAIVTAAVRANPDVHPDTVCRLVGNVIAERAENARLREGGLPTARELEAWCVEHRGWKPQGHLWQEWEDGLDAIRALRVTEIEVPPDGTWSDPIGGDGTGAALDSTTEAEVPRMIPAEELPEWRRAMYGTTEWRRVLDGTTETDTDGPECRYGCDAEGCPHL